MSMARSSRPARPAEGASDPQSSSLMTMNPLAALSIRTFLTIASIAIRIRTNQISPMSLFKEIERIKTTIKLKMDSKIKTDSKMKMPTRIQVTIAMGIKRRKTLSDHVGGLIGALGDPKKGVQIFYAVS